MKSYNPEKMILTAGPSISEKEIEYVTIALKEGWNENWSGYIREFEHQFSQYIGVKYAMTTSSCTGAMHLSLVALGIGPGDEVLVPELTWVATASVVEYVGAKPVFIDVDEETWTINPQRIESAINSRTKAIMPVHLYGHPAQIDSIEKIADQHNLHIIEDAAPAIGALFNGKNVGTFGDFAAFSFQGAKMLVTGEGGMLVTDSEELYLKAKQYGDHGRSLTSPSSFLIDKVGYKYKMSNIQAALGLAQLERIDELITKKRQIFTWYFDRLNSIDGLHTNHEADWARSIYWMTSIFLKSKFNISRDELIELLKKDMIDTRPVFPPISHFPMWPQIDNPIATDIGRNAMNLPSGHNLSEDQVDYICERIRRHLRID